MSTNAMVKLLQETPFFGGISDNIVQFILDSAIRVVRHENEYFFKENEIGDSMFYLLVGSVEIVKFANGKDYTINNLFIGDCFGEMAIIEHNVRSASVKAQEDCVALEIKNQTLIDIYQKDLKQFAMLQMNLSREISRRLRSINERLFHHYVKADKTISQDDIRLLSY